MNLIMESFHLMRGSRLCLPINYEYIIFLTLLVAKISPKTLKMASKFCDFSSFNMTFLKIKNGGIHSYFRCLEGRVKTYLFLTASQQKSSIIEILLKFQQFLFPLFCNKFYFRSLTPVIIAQ